MLACELEELVAQPLVARVLVGAGGPGHDLGDRLKAGDRWLEQANACCLTDVQRQAFVDQGDEASSPEQKRGAKPDPAVISVLRGTSRKSSRIPASERAWPEEVAR